VPILSLRQMISPYVWVNFLNPLPAKTEVAENLNIGHTSNSYRFWKCRHPSTTFCFFARKQTDRKSRITFSGLLKVQENLAIDDKRRDAFVQTTLAYAIVKWFGTQLPVEHCLHR